MYRTLNEKEKEIDRQYADLCKHRDKLLTELKAKTMTNDEIDNAMLTRERIIRGLQNPTFEMKRAFLDFIRLEATIKGGRAEVKGNLPVKVRVFDLATEINSQVNQEPDRWLTLLRTYDLDEVARAFFAKVPQLVTTEVLQ
jgi:hypothetical protein